MGKRENIYSPFLHFEGLNFLHEIHILGKPTSTSPHFEDDTKGKPYCSGLKVDTIIYSLKAQHVTCKNES